MLFRLDGKDIDKEVYSGNDFDGDRGKSGGHIVDPGRSGGCG